MNKPANMAGQPPPRWFGLVWLLAFSIRPAGASDDPPEPPHRIPDGHVTLTGGGGGHRTHTHMVTGDGIRAGPGSRSQIESSPASRPSPVNRSSQG